MFDDISKCSVFVWNIFSVISTDHKACQVIYSTALMMCCAYVIYVTPHVVCVLENNCDNSFPSLLKGMFARVVAAVGLISRFVLLVKGDKLFVRYKRNVDDFHACTPMTRTEATELNRFSFLVVLCSVLLVVPVNALRLWLLWSVAESTLTYFVLTYAMNFSMYCIETHFTVLCFVLYQKFAGINGDLTALKADTFACNKYPRPFASHPARAREERKLCGCGAEHDDNEIAAIRRTQQRATAGKPAARDFVEKLKIKHKLVREAVKNLNDAFGIHLTLSLCSLCLYIMFDLYYHILGLWNPSKSLTLVYGWILQYFTRFAFVTIIANMTTKQAHKSKMIISDINNRYLDNDVKEELQLFFHQISSCTVEFTACDLFTLNTHLITSAIAAGTSYLVILLQFNTLKE